MKIEFNVSVSCSFSGLANLLLKLEVQNLVFCNLSGFFTLYSNNYMYCIMHPCKVLKNYKLIKHLKVNICLKYGRTVYCKWIQYENTLQVSGKYFKICKMLYFLPYS